MKVSDLKSKRIGVIAGGDSPEREISMKTGEAVFRALKRLGYDVRLIQADKNMVRSLFRHKIEVVFNALHGGMGENGCVQGLLEVLGIPYTGSGPLASGLCMNKRKTKEVLIANRIPTPEYFSIKKGEPLFDFKFDTPVVVKPVDGGSSIGVSIVRRKSDFAGAVKQAMKYSNEAIVEKYIEGKEVTVGILGDRAIGAMEVISKKGFLSFKVKYTPGLEEFIMPAPLPSRIYKRVMDYAEKAYAALGCSGYSRVDTRVTSTGKVYILEVNTLPGLTSLSYLPRIAAWRKINYDSLIERILLTSSLKGG